MCAFIDKGKGEVCMSNLEREIRDMIKNGVLGNKAFFICKENLETSEDCTIPEYALDSIWNSLKADGLVK